MSIAALVLGLIGIIPPGVAVAGLAAIACGIVGLLQLNRQGRGQGPVQKGRWMAVTGIVLGTVMVALVALFVFGGSSDSI